MKIQRIFNNNIVATVSPDGAEMIVTGPGIGYLKKIGDIIDNQKIEKRFRIENTQKNKFYQMLEKIPVEYFEISEAIFKKASKQFKAGLSSQVVIMLTDHIAFALEREKQGIKLPNLLLPEIKKMYHREYDVGIWAIKYIALKTGVSLPEDEAGFIAMHIINANNPEDSNAEFILTFSKEVLEIIEQCIDLKSQDNEYDYSRLTQHLKYLGQRIFNKSNVKSQEASNENMINMMLQTNPKIKKCIEKICNFIYNHYDYTLDKQDQLYIIIHIFKITN